MRNFWKVVFAVVIGSFIYNTFLASPNPTNVGTVNLDQPFNGESIDQLIYNSCNRDLRTAVVENNGHYVMDLDAIIFCKDHISDFQMKDLHATTKLFYTREFSVITPDGVRIDAPLESSYTMTTEEEPGIFYYSVYETYAIDGLTGYDHIVIADCDQPLTGTIGALTIASCD